MERIGIYGGSFNPLHVGHLRAANFAKEAFRLDKLLLIPSCVSCHKAIPENSPTDAQRLDMLCLATADCDGLEVCDMELQRGGVSYTWETVEQLRAQYPDAEFFLCMGTDMFLSFHSWKHPERILSQVTLAVLDRGGKCAEEVKVQKARLEEMGARIVLADNPVTCVSSTDLRRMLAFGCADAFLPDSVMRYILSFALYGTDEDFEWLPMDRLEQAVIGLLKPNRVAHVLGCRDTAAELAKIWGADETDAARAGMLHDITKALDGPLQLDLCRAYGVELSAFSQANPKTLHALTGSLVAERIFGENEAVVAAIRSHTTGKANMNTLEKIIYVADYMEPNRDFPGVEELRRLAYTDLDKALKMGLEMTLAMLKEQGREVSPESQQALAWLNEHV